jgi:3-hydroxymyristoyl/3-hydroxydecanoyl-(acyl carrier protein) dehydratase
MSLGSTLYPEILAKEIDENKGEMVFRIPEDLAYCEGHFPDIPIVPGVVQLHWAVEFAQDLFKIPLEVLQANQVKFSNLMRPGAIVQLTLEHLTEKHAITYRYQSGEKMYSSGSIHYLS